MYAGLTTADKGALLDAKARGAEWMAREDSGALWGYATKPENVAQFIGNFTWSVSGYDILEGSIEMDSDTCKFIKHDATEPVNIDLALAQIAEMESKQKELLFEKANEKGCLTMNERINQMTVEEKAKWLYDLDVCRVSSISIDECNSYRHCTECMRNMLNSPYTEGETE